MTIALILFLGLAPTLAEERVAPEVDFLALNDEMRQFLDKHVGHLDDPTQRLNHLVHVIFSEKLLNLEYDNSRTRTAIETFQSKNGNCISFTAMFVAMARYLGIDAQFQEVTNFPDLEQIGEYRAAQHAYERACNGDGPALRDGLQPIRGPQGTTDKGCFR